jgi:biotin carboxyl carrier protein
VKYVLNIEGREHVLELDSGASPAYSLDGVAFSGDVAKVRPGVYSVLIGERSFAAHVDTAAAAVANECAYVIQVDGATYDVLVQDPRRRERGRARLTVEGKQTVKAPMPGRVVKVLVAEGQAVEAGHGLVVVEAMKMQNEIKCQRAGKIGKIPVKEGQAVNAGETLLVVE